VTTKQTFSWSKVTPEQQAKLLEVIGGDGHTIWSADGLIEDGIDASIVAAFTRVEKSDSSYKGSIFTDQGRVAELRGVYGLTVIRSLAAYYSETSGKFGRGSEARELTEKIRTHLEAGA